MRKILLGTTAVVGAALLGMTGAQAQEAPTVRVGGYFEFTGGYIDDTADRGAVGIGTGANRNVVSRDKIDFRTDMEVVIIVRGKAANGLSYGAEIEMQMDNAFNTGAGSAYDNDEAWGFVSTPTLGTLQFGDQDSAASQMAVSVPSVTNLGMSSGWDEFVVPSVDGIRYLVADINDGNDSTKIIYLSPQFFGFDFGVSFAPNGREGEEYRSIGTANGAGTTFQRDPNDSIQNEISAGIRYRGSFGNIGVAASFVGMHADAPETALNVSTQDVTQYQAGLNLSGFGLTAGGFYSWGKFGGVTRGALASGRDSSTNYGLGLTYRTGAIAVGAFYARGERDNGTSALGVNLSDRTQTTFGVGAVYTIAAGLEAFANYTNIEDKNMPGGVVGSGAGGRDREIDVFIIGTRLAF